MTPAEERESLIEQLVSAWRPQSVEGGIQAHPAWHDLPPADRAEAAERAQLARRLEAALDPDGLSSTGRAVLARITRR